jgi:hypothetical protein
MRGARSVGFWTAPTLITAAVAGATSLAAIVLGGPRVGYLPGIVVSTAVVLVITWRNRPRQYILWFAALLLALYHVGAVVMVGDGVLARVAVGNGVIRYDRGLHVLGAIVVVLLISEIGIKPDTGDTWSIIGLALAAGFAVEVLELSFALAAPHVFSYDLHDSTLDTAANAIGTISAVTFLIQTDLTGLDSRAKASI